jgi:hypothetical protein
MKTQIIFRNSPSSQTRGLRLISGGGAAQKCNASKLPIALLLAIVSWWSAVPAWGQSDRDPSGARVIPAGARADNVSAPLAPTNAAARPRPRILADTQMNQGARRGQERPEEKLRSVGDIREPSADYDAELVAAVRRHWAKLLQQTHRMPGKGKVVLQFNLHQDGRISDMKVVVCELEAYFGSLCQQAVLAIAPLPPWQPQMRRQIGADHHSATITFSHFEGKYQPRGPFMRADPAHLVCNLFYQPRCWVDHQHFVEETPLRGLPVRIAHQFPSDLPGSMESPFLGSHYPMLQMPRNAWSEFPHFHPSSQSTPAGRK